MAITNNGTSDSNFEENGRRSKYAESNDESDDQQTDNNTDDEDYLANDNSRHSSDNEVNNNGVSSNESDNNMNDDSETDQDNKADDDEDMDYETEQKPNVEELNSKIKHEKHPDKHHDKHQSTSNNDSSHHNNSNNSVRVKKEKKRISYKEDDSDYDSDYESRPKKKLKKAAVSSDDEDYEEEYSSPKKKKESSSKKEKKKSKKEKESSSKSKSKDKKKKDKDKKKSKSKGGKEAVKAELKSPTKGKKKKEENTEHIWKWWEEVGNQDASIKWKTLSHSGPVFAASYEPLPSHVKFYYDGKVMKLQPRAEEIATFYGRMIDHDYTSKKVFNDNFFHDWKKYMTAEERETITDLKKCNFIEIDKYFKEQSEIRKSRTKEEKLDAKQKEEKIKEKYGWCIVDGHKQQIGNYKIEPPGLFRGRGEQSIVCLFRILQ